MSATETIETSKGNSENSTCHLSIAATESSAIVVNSLAQDKLPPTDHKALPIASVQWASGNLGKFFSQPTIRDKELTRMRDREGGALILASVEVCV
jgi:hypothetical protein